MGSAAIGEFATEHPMDLDSLDSQVIAIDAFIELHQFVHSITDDYGDYVRNDEGRPISHLIGLVSRLGPVLDAGVRPIYVFDGGAHELKDEELERRSRPADIEERFRAAKMRGDEETAKRLSYQYRTVTDEMVESAMELIESFGVPTIRAPGEAEPQCAQLVSESTANHTASQDWDTMLYGVPTMLRDFNASGATLVLLDDMLEETGWTAEQLRWYAVLRGTDYNRGAHNVGSVRGRKIVTEADTFEEVMRAAGRYDSDIDYGRWRRVLDLFDDQAVDTGVSVSWEPFDRDTVYGVACEEYGLADWQVESRLKYVDNSHIFHS